jgi:hypothetical protein
MIQQWLAAVCALLMLSSGLTAEAARWKRVRPRCETALSSSVHMSSDQALKVLVESARMFAPEPAWSQVIKSYLLPSVGSSAQNLVLTLVGPSNSGKSLIFNSVRFFRSPHSEPLGDGLKDPSTVSFDAQSTARPVLMFSDNLFDDKGTFDPRFPNTERWKMREQTLERGPPLVFLAADFFRNLILVDTPAFNWPTSREQVVGLMQSSDVLIYVFSNANYDDAENLAFLHDWQTANGPRDIILVYNVNAAIPAEVIRNHFKWVTDKISTMSDEDDPPLNVIGAYQMVHSEKVGRGEQLEELIAHGVYPSFEDLLLSLDKNSASHRRQLLHLTLGHVLESAEAGLSQLERNEAELRLTEQIFAKYLDYLIDESLTNFPFYRLGSELELNWNRQASGLRGFAHWIAHPLRMAGLSRGSGGIQMPVVREMERNLETVVEQVSAKFRLGAAEHAVRIPATNARAVEVAELVRKFNLKFPVAKDAENPSAEVKDGQYLVKLPSSAAMDQYFEQYLRRDWPAVVAESKKEAIENFSDLTVRIQTQLNEIARQQGVTVRGGQAAYVTLAVLPTLMAVAYMAYRGTGLTDLQTLSSIFGAHLAARLFVTLDQKSLQKGWNQAVQDWFTKRQEPRLNEIFLRHLGVKPAAISEERGRENMRHAIESLKASGL